MTILRLENTKPRRRVLYLNSYGMAVAWRMFEQGQYPGQHLWGCLELVQMGYEVAMPEELDRSSAFYNYRRQDFKHIGFARRWLGSEGIVYSAHTVVFWTPLLASLNLLRAPVVSLLYARGENIRFSRGYAGLLALTPAAESRARDLAPAAKVAHLGWGVDLSFFPVLPYQPRWFLSSGKTRRDFKTLCAVAAASPLPVQVINPQIESELKWPSNVEVFTGRAGQEWETVSYHDLIYEHYAGCSAALILLQEDVEERYAAGFTQMLEAMALGRPVIVTRTGALAGEIDVEKEGCGLFVPPNDEAALARAMRTVSDDPAQAEAMGLAGRRICETRYSTERFGKSLHEFFERL